MGKVRGKGNRERYNVLAGHILRRRLCYSFEILLFCIILLVLFLSLLFQPPYAKVKYINISIMVLLSM